jgi:hypothetical protein
MIYIMQSVSELLDAHRIGHCILAALGLAGPLSSELLFDQRKLQLRSANRSSVATPVQLSRFVRKSQRALL